jgi:hypothetical protein
LQRVAVEDGDQGPVVSNDAIVSEYVTEIRNSGPASAQMLGYSFVRQRQMRIVGSVINHQQPRAKTFLQSVTTIAHSPLRNLLKPCVRIIQNRPLHQSTLGKFSAHFIGSNAQCAAADCRQRPMLSAVILKNCC